MGECHLATTPSVIAEHVKEAGSATISSNVVNVLILSISTTTCSWPSLLFCRSWYTHSSLTRLHHSESEFQFFSQWSSTVTFFFRFSKEIMMLYWSAILEVGLSALLTVFLSEPMFSFDIYSCGVSSLADWYTYFFNPSPRYESVLICTQERVYPLQTMVLIFYVFCVTFMLVLRPIINEKVKPTIAKPSMAVYHALYAFPLLALIHSLFGGLVYFAFPYLSIIISCGANAGHFAMKLDQTTKSLLVTSVSDIRNIIIIGEVLTYKWRNGPSTTNLFSVGNWLLFSFGIVSIKKYYLLFLTPIPSIFYIATSKYTNPEIYWEENVIEDF